MDKTHRRRLRPARGPIYDETELNMATALTRQNTRHDSATIEDVIPFQHHPCSKCDDEGLREFILLNVNNAEQHIKAHHKGAKIHFTCAMKHAAKYHVPKCPGPREPIQGCVTCDMSSYVFNKSRPLTA